MSMIESQGKNCPRCRKGRLVPASRMREFAPRGKRVQVSLQTSRCEGCGQETTSAAQHRANLEALAERKTHYDGLMLGEEILALRARYGLTQQAAAKVFGKGKIAFSRYENERTYPDDSTTLLLRGALEKPEFMRWLADQAGVALPMWKERCEDEQRVKVRSLSLVHGAEERLLTHGKSIAHAKSIELAGGKAVSFGALVRAMSMRIEPMRQSVMMGKACNDGDLQRETMAS